MQLNLCLTPAIDYAIPLLLQQLLQSLENPSSPSRASISYAALSLLARLIASQSAVFSLWYSRRCYERSRGEMITMLYEKTLSRKAIGAQLAPDKNGAIGLNANTKVQNTMSVSSMSNWPSVIQRIFRTLVFWKTPTIEVTKQPASMGKILNLMRQVLKSSKSCTSN